MEFPLLFPLSGDCIGAWGLKGCRAAQAQLWHRTRLWAGCALPSLPPSCPRERDKRESLSAGETHSRTCMDFCQKKEWLQRGKHVAQDGLGHGFLGYSSTSHCVKGQPEGLCGWGDMAELLFLLSQLLFPVSNLFFSSFFFPTKAQQSPPELFFSIFCCKNKFHDSAIYSNEKKKTKTQQKTPSYIHLNMFPAYFFSEMKQNRQEHLSFSASTEILCGPKTPHPLHASKLNDFF